MWSINLEYYFSRVDNHKLGAGTKLPHNVVGLIGVSNGCDGDLRPGLPVQMIEVHDPVRLLVVVEHRPEIVLQCIQSNSAMYEWFINEWVHLIAFDPIEKKFFLFKNGEFTEYIPLRNHLGILENSELLFENASLMDSAHIADATKENLPVFVLN